MFTLVVFASLAYFAVGLGFAMLSLHELATNGRSGPLNRLMAWSGVLFWLPMLLAIVVTAFLASRRPVQSPVPAAATSTGAIIAERRATRRAARRV
ncbi:hypothetical protein [Pleomorphomonas diazotrophica]|uniref:hypothetical protein n=1 Tax=Pleomorphomonas diazotrophica TaxID=1166257 RepID=UPI00117FA585|nr:hypothetical protein [Pleomorphomonas diazotrophica]